VNELGKQAANRWSKQMTHDSLTRRAAVAGSLAALGAGAGASAAFSQEPPVRPNLYNGELDYLAQEWRGRIEDIPARTRIATLREPGEAMTLSGRVTSWRTSAPVAGVIVYAYHTDTTGVYWKSPSSNRHARLEGWARTGADGIYAFDTIKPGIYPDRRGPAHFHMTVVEPNRPPYWIDEVVFEGEYGVTPAYNAAQGRRGGIGTVQLTKDASGVLQAVRDIRLERHPA
jgi:protocatechuate 3,4-dioxygenase, beta subunit